ncbi:hypothetical protein [Chitinophaga sp. CB10]|uniref:hypothetical protein n=1 Tax=Chitinophaga sp. CB10 TaxID=1891659 RepID=UPI0025BA59FE|nr:hypothetical protein [Chitinophaga sp. CB10]
MRKQTFNQMGTFFSILGFIFLLLILKFIYDTYLTNNTEKRWQHHVKHNPSDKEYYERKFGQYIDTTPTLNYKGFYLHKSEVLIDGILYRSAQGIFFSDVDAFIFKMKENDFDMHPAQIKNKIPTLFTENSFARIEAVAEYQLERNKVRITFNFIDKKYEEFEGEITENGIIFNSHSSVTILGITKEIKLCKNAFFQFHIIQ